LEGATKRNPLIILVNWITIILHFPTLFWALDKDAFLFFDKIGVGYHVDSLDRCLFSLLESCPIFAATQNSYYNIKGAPK
jgi:hypothetical protein